MNILVAIDASKATSIIVNELIRRHWGQDMTIRLLYVLNSGSFTSDFVDVESYVEAEYEAATSLLKKYVNQLAKNGMEASFEVRKGKPAKCIINYAKEWKADLILLASHGHSSLSTLLLGTTAKEVLRHAPCSIEIIRAASERRAKGAELKILLATDGSDCSSAAARALTTGIWNTGEIHIISVVQETSPALESFAGLSLMSGVMPEPVIDALRVAARQATLEARGILEAKGLKVSDTVLFGDIKVSISEYANEWGADLIVVGSHGKHGFERLFEGSVSESIALYAPCSVAVIHDPIPC